MYEVETSVMKSMVLTAFFGLAACGGGSESMITPPAPVATVQGTPIPDAPEIPSTCTTCLGSNRIASHAIIFTGMPAATKELLASAAASSHSGMIRLDLTWVSVQPAFPEVYDWRWVDESVRAAKKNNLEILALVAETPQWASSKPDDPSFRSYPPKAEYWVKWEAFIKAFVDRYGAKGTSEIHHWEIWGEANDDGQWLGTAAEYAQLYSLAYKSIKASDPTAQVLMAGLNESKMPQWLNAVLTDGSFPAKNKIDIIDVHIRGSFARVKDLAAGAKEVFRLQGVVNKPIWITEFGFPSSPTFQREWNSDFIGATEGDGEQKQADYYDTVVPWLLTEGGIDKLFVTLRDIDAPNTPWESEGLVTQEATPKIAFNVIKGLADRYR